ncbi:MAG: energy-coupling factor ABC transporter ATP-binding protein [Proteobacteria bacterium]|nr:energy-coupling factor ABC transporter ATP-binding protein [Pseudomonadota bacterium]
MDYPVYHIKNLHHDYGEETILSVDELTIHTNAITGLIGPNGSGKSTLLKLLSFVEKPKKGEIRFKGEPAVPFSAATRFKVSLLTQEPYLMKRSVYHNILYGLKIRNVAGDIDAKINEALNWVGLSGKDFFSRKWYELSGGETQRVALAARLVLKPEVLLMDEPTANVDTESSQLIRKAALKAREEWGTTLVIASHDREWLYDVSDHVLHLYQGKLIRSGLGNFFVGPFNSREDGLFEKKLPDGQHLILKKPIANLSSIAILPSELVKLDLMESALPGLASIKGIISKLLLEKPGRQILISVQIGDIQITSKLPLDTVKTNHLYPGRTVWVSFDPDKVIWG